MKQNFYSSETLQRNNRRALIGQRPGRKLAYYPLVIKLPCRCVAARPRPVFTIQHHCHTTDVQTSACT